MAELAIHLLGRPQVLRDGVPVARPRGHKVWGVLAYLLLSERSPSREQLVSLLFAEADDPMGALRWNLHAARRLLGEGASVAGDPVDVALPPGSRLDVETVRSGSWSDAVALPGVGRELLEGVGFSSSPAFEIWLVTERRHLAGASEAVLREAALTRLGIGDAGGAAEIAARLVQTNPLDENLQVLLVRSLAAAGEGVEAARQVARCIALFRHELGVDPSPAVAAAAQTLTAAPTAGPVSGRAAARAQLEAGEAAIAAGALDAGLHCLRRAVTDAREVGDAELVARSLVALGGALVHAARGRDEEASAALHEALALGVTPSAAAASRELGYVEFLRGRYDRAELWLRRAEVLAGDDGAERGRIGAVLGSVLSDTARYTRATEVLRRAREVSESAGDWRQVSYTVSMLGRAHLLRGELDEAAEALDESLHLARRENWAAFTPWPEALRGDVDLARGDIDAAAERYEHAFAMGCQLGDPCWEGLAARGLGLVAAARGDTDQAVEWLQDAGRRAARLPDAYVWVVAYTLDALCSVGGPSVAAWADELAELAASTGMRELAARACVHRPRTAYGPALTAVRLLIESIDNPALRALLPELTTADVTVS